ncbi:MAG: chloride channel protein [Acidobacteriota bacterium]|nr:chloride channel protein [Acidobacteriota bacterium]
MDTPERASSSLARPAPTAEKADTGWGGFGQTQRFLVLSILIGLFAGLMVVCFHIIIDFISWFTLGSPVGASWQRTLLAPTIGGLIAATLVRYVFRKARGSGVNHTKAALYVYDGYVPFSTVIGKFLACSASLGTGNSLGPEDPALQMGAGVASLLGRMFDVDKEHMRLIAPIGAAAGLAAAFNTPITAVLFVIEQVIAAWDAGVLGSIVLSAVSAVVVVRWFLGDHPLFHAPAFQLTHPSELLIYAAIGVIVGLLGVLFVKLIARLHGALEKLPHSTALLRPVVAGFLVGCFGLWLPQVMGVGYDVIDSALRDQFVWQTLLLLGIVKMVATLLCFSAETPGGMFAPTLFTGAMVGGGIGALAHLYWPFPMSSSAAYILVGMGTFFAAVFRTPMTAIFMVFEVSASYVIILPVMIASTIAYLISRYLQPIPFFELIARQEGVDLPSLEAQRERQPMLVENAMQRGTILTLSADMSVDAALAALRSAGLPHGLVAVERGTWSWVTLEDLEGAAGEARGTATIRQAFPLAPAPRLYPDMALDTALRLLGPHRLLPVLNRARAGQVLGIITLEDIHRAYGIHKRHHDEPADAGNAAASPAV